MVVVVGANLLHQPVVYAVEGDVDADDFEGLGADPGDVALGVLVVAGLGWVVRAQRGFLGTVHFLVFHAAVEDFGFFGLDEDLLLQVELNSLGGRDEADRDVPLPGGVVAEEDIDGAVAVIHHLAGDQEVQLHRLDVGIEISPTKNFFQFARGRLQVPLTSGMWSVIPLREVVQDIPQLPRAAHQLQEGHILQQGWGEQGFGGEQLSSLLCLVSLLALRLTLLSAFPWPFLAADHLNTVMAEREGLAVGTSPLSCSPVIPPSPGMTQPSPFLSLLSLFPFSFVFPFCHPSISPISFLATIFSFSWLLRE